MVHHHVRCCMHCKGDPQGCYEHLQSGPTRAHQAVLHMLQGRPRMLCVCDITQCPQVCLVVQAVSCHHQGGHLVQLSFKNAWQMEAEQHCHHWWGKGWVGDGKYVGLSTFCVLWMTEIINIIILYSYTWCANLSFLSMWATNVLELLDFKHPMCLSCDGMQNYKDWLFAIRHLLNQVVDHHIMFLMFLLRSTGDHMHCAYTFCVCLADPKKATNIMSCHLSVTFAIFQELLTFSMQLLRPHMAARFWSHLLLGFGFRVLWKSLLWQGCPM